MPTYVYHCSACEKDYEIVQRMSDDALTTCECGESGRIKRLLSAGAGVIFKGSGFYETDYKRASNGKGESKSGEKSTSSETKKSDSSSSSTASASSSSSSSSSSGGSGSTNASASSN